MAGKYRNDHALPLCTPLQVLVGRQDDVVAMDAGQAGLLHAGRDFAFTATEGGHLWLEGPDSKQASCTEWEAPSNQMSVSNQ